MRNILILLSLATCAAGQCRYQFGRMCLTEQIGEVVSITPESFGGVASPGLLPLKNLTRAEFATAVSRLNAFRHYDAEGATLLFDAPGSKQNVAATLQVRPEQVRIQNRPRFRVGDSEFAADDVVVVKPRLPLSDAQWSSIFVMFEAAPVRSASAELLRRNNGLHLLRSTKHQNAFDLAMAMQANSLLEFAEPDYVIGIRPQSAGLSPRSFMPGRRRWSNDPFLAQQWALRNGGKLADAQGGIGLQNLWRVAGLTVPPVVAVVDDGVQSDHPDLAPQLLPAFDATGSHSVLAPGSGQYLFNSHGTRVAGIIASSADNGFGILGAAPFARILPVRAFYRASSASDYSTFQASELASALSYAGERSSVINISWFYNDLKDIQGITEVLRQMPLRRGGLGVVVVASAGNFGSPITYPASLSREIPGLIAVGASDRSDSVKRCVATAQSCNGSDDWGSGTGPGLDVVAPGVDVLSAYPCLTKVEASCFAPFNGTSAAAPYVSALAAHLLARNPKLTAAEVKETIRSTADPLDWKVPNTWSGYGRINICRAVGGTACNLIDVDSSVRLTSSVLPRLPAPSGGEPAVTQPGKPASPPK